MVVQLGALLAHQEHGDWEVSAGVGPWVENGGAGLEGQDEILAVFQGVQISVAENLDVGDDEVGDHGLGVLLAVPKTVA